ncbi:MAG: class I SAM-dependent methyltransferase [Myxococcales bacterium]|nr:class I SAM-dependent methyltransferase [Myxococcales bacterium]MCB9734978.1 methyltransferase regulatory domain-containing protein [Deltaproteobacteria bacterium]
MTTTDAAILYDTLPYPRLVHSWTHPRVTGAMALFFGVDAAPVERCRVLDLGCAAGTSLVSLAAELPGSRFVGVDVSPGQIAAGEDLRQALGLDNVELRVGDVNALDLPEKGFDYIIAHGVYSWVPPRARRAILAACARLLDDGGVAYVSYDTNPGWQLAGVVRELFVRETPTTLPPLERVRLARDLLAQHIDIAGEGSLRRAVLLAEQEFLRGASDAYIFHEYFAPDLAAVWVRDFLDDAADAGLAYIADARPERVLPLSLPPRVAAAVADAPDAVTREQVIDHHANTRFRRSLLTRAGTPLALAVDPARLGRLHVSMERTRRVARQPWGAAVTNRAEHALRVENRAVADLLEALSREAPRSVPIAELVDLADERGAREILGQLVGLFFTEVVDLTLAPIDAATRLPERPRASALAREQARRGDAVTSAVYVSQVLDPLAQALVPLLDGTRTVAELAAAVGADEQDVEGHLRVLLDASVLSAPG